MYTFRIYDADVKKKKKRPQKKIGQLEFTDIVRSDEAFNKKKVRQIKKSKVELIKPKPRNMFMIFRCLAKHLIQQEVQSYSFTDTSKILSIIWSKRTPSLEKYVRYLEEQDEIYKDSAYSNSGFIIEESDSTNKKVYHLNQSNNKVFKHYKVNKTKKKKETKLKKEKSLVRKTVAGQLRIEDVYIDANNR